MMTKSSENAANTGKIALLVGIIVLALAALVFVYFRSTTSSGTVQGETKQMKASARGGRRTMQPGTGP